MLAPMADLRLLVQCVKVSASIPVDAVPENNVSAELSQLFDARAGGVVPENNVSAEMNQLHDARVDGASSTVIPSAVPDEVESAFLDAVDSAPSHPTLRTV